jgi:hypothetical protein
MPEPRAQRTLVKSPPELWAEISDVSTLARHLGEFGEIRITRLEAETTVVWEGDRARGTVELEPSGWGTKVTLTAEAVAAEGEAEAALVVEPEPPAVEPAPEPVPEPELVAIIEPEPEPEPEELEAVVEPEAAAKPKVGLLARLFRRRAIAHVAEPDPAPIAVIEPAPAPEPVAEPEPEPVAVIEPEPEPEPDAVAPPEPAPALDHARVEAVLVGVLDDLGSAHHRPFSRG